MVGLTTGPPRSKLAWSTTGRASPPGRQKIFERFTRGQPSALEPGSGFRLAIAAEIAKLHGVTIDLASGPTDAGRG